MSLRASRVLSSTQHTGEIKTWRFQPKRNIQVRKEREREKDRGKEVAGCVCVCCAAPIDESRITNASSLVVGPVSARLPPVALPTPPTLGSASNNSRIFSP